MNGNSKFLLVLAVTLFACFLMYPTMKWYFFISELDKKISSYSKEILRDYSKKRAYDDLYKLRELHAKNSKGDVPFKLQYLISIAKKNYKTLGMKLPSTWDLEALKTGFLEDSQIQNLSFDIYKRYEAIKNIRGKVIQLGLDLLGGMNVTISLDYTNLEKKLGRNLSLNEKNDSVERTMEVLKERVDRFGLTEPKIIREVGGNRIFLDIPGEKDDSHINTLFSGKGSLFFYVVDQDLTETLNNLILNSGPLYNIDLLIKDLNLEATTKKVFPWYTKDVYDVDDETTVKYYVVSTDANHTFDGTYIKNAGLGNDFKTGKDIVTFELNLEGSEKFFNYTSRHVDKFLAVVMEDKIKSVAGISTAIAGGNVSIQGDSFTRQEANELALVFKTAAFPVEIIIDDLRVIGPTLGARTIDLSVKASILALALIFIFMIVYYRTSGLVASLSLIYNLFLIIAILSAFNMTLTLTSIAGLVLTIGMAVDINIVVYERIKEEFRKGLRFEIAFMDGFTKAFWTVMDANITTFIAVLFLTLLGTGTIQGFAWSLSVGIISSLFSSLIVSRFILGYLISIKENKYISISWSSKYAQVN